MLTVPVSDGGILLAVLFLFGIFSGLMLLFGLYQAQQERSSRAGSTTVQELANQIPCAVWFEENGKTIWRNKACDALAGPDPGFCLAQLPLVSGRFENDRAIRVQANPKSSTPDMEYEVSRRPVAEGWIYVAQEAVSIVEAEKDLRRFLDTLTDTFAHMSTGLAVFDRRRDLLLFNPALSELFDLPVEYLARRPSLHSFLDRLRDANAIPGRAEYEAIRQDLMDLEKGQSNQPHTAEWTQPSGRIYSIIGRPHPRGGVALTVDDVSKAIVNERRYRTALSELYSALDNLPQGIAIFDVAGELVVVNEAFDLLWDSDYGQSLAPVTIDDFVRTLSAKCLASSFWNDLASNDLNQTARDGGVFTLQKLDSTKIEVRVSSVTGGKVMLEMAPSLSGYSSGGRAAA